MVSQDKAVTRRGDNTPAPVESVTSVEKAKYFASVALPVGVGLELLGAGMPGLVLAAFAGSAAWYFSQEIKAALQYVPLPKIASGSPLASRSWWLTGKVDEEEKLPDTEAFTDIAQEDEQTHQVDEEEDELEEREHDEGTKPAAGTVRIPTAPPFKDMCSLINERRLVLCYTAKGPLFGTVEDLLSMAIVGMPGRGKTIALTFYVGQLLFIGAQVVVWDPHGSLSELAGIPGLSYIDELADLSASMDTLEAELAERRRLYKAGRQVKHPLLLLVDELPVIGHYGKRHDPRVFDMTEAFTLEARKWHCYFIGAGQSTDADILPTRVVENLSSRIVFACSNRRAQMAGLSAEAIRDLLPVIRPNTPELKGKMIFDCSRLSEPVIGAIPLTTVADLIAFLGLGRERSVSRVSQSTETGNGGTDRRKQVETAQEAAGAITEKVIAAPFPVSTETAETDDFRSTLPVSDDILEIIAKMKADPRNKDRDIAQVMGLSGRKYGIYRQCLVYLGYREEA